MTFFAQRVFYELSVLKVYVCTTVLDRHKIQDSGRVLPYLLSRVKVLVVDHFSQLFSLKSIFFHSIVNLFKKNVYVYTVRARLILLIYHMKTLV